MQEGDLGRYSIWRMLGTLAATGERHLLRLRANRLIAGVEIVILTCAWLVLFDGNKSVSVEEVKDAWNKLRILTRLRLRPTRHVQ
jgi:hypothetical protein